jgi:hypothetical protein
VPEEQSLDPVERGIGTRPHRGLVEATEGVRPLPLEAGLHRLPWIVDVEARVLDHAIAPDLRSAAISAAV